MVVGDSTAQVSNNSEVMVAVAARVAIRNIAVILRVAPISNIEVVVEVAARLAILLRVVVMGD